MTREDAIQRATRILAQCYSPERIYLIGSSARGDANSAWQHAVDEVTERLRVAHDDLRLADLALGAVPLFP